MPQLSATVPTSLEQIEAMVARVETVAGLPALEWVRDDYSGAVWAAEEHLSGPVTAA